MDIQVDFYRENPSFDKSYHKMGEEIAARIKRANLVFAKDFQKLSPTHEQAKRFGELSGFKFGEYTMTRFKSNQLPERDYKVVGSFPDLVFAKPNILSLEMPQAGIQCKAIFR